MKLTLASLAWLLISAVLALGIYLVTTTGNPWLLIVWIIGFVVAVGKIGCASH